MTEDVLKKFGIKVQRSNNLITVNGSQVDNSQLSTMDYVLPPDYSTACYYWFYSYLLKKEIYIKNDCSIYQPDYDFKNVLKSIGINIIDDTSEGAISVSPDKSAITINMTNMPDQIITLSFWLLTLYNNTKVDDTNISNKTCWYEIIGCGTLIYKESNRIEGILENIKLLGGEATYSDRILTIFPLNKEPLACTLKTYNDHRFAMTFLVLKQKYPYLQIDNVNCVYKSIAP
jgi:3-phosphoshikimate 1-carboxyvinyltransferase